MLFINFYWGENGGKDGHKDDPVSKALVFTEKTPNLFFFKAC